MKVILTFFLFLISFTNITSRSLNKIDSYSILKGDSLPSRESYEMAISGFEMYKKTNKVKKNILTIIDFNLSSTKKRLWVIDMEKNEVIFNTLVAHGINTGGEYASFFSNSPNSYKSSLGFYTTGEVYQGKHGKSLKLDGLEIGKNNNARKRCIVIHGANYVSDEFIKQHKFLGRSQGCPALPMDISDSIIGFIKDKSCIFIHHKNS